MRLAVLNFGILLPDNNLILRKIGSKKMKQQDTTKQYKCIKITYFWHKIHVVQYICTNALEEPRDSALNVTLKMETAGAPGMLVPMYYTTKHHKPDINPFQSNFSASRIPAEKQKECNLHYLLAKVCTTRGKASNRLRQRSGRTNATKKRVGRHPTSERKRKIIMSDEVRRRIGKG